MWSYIIRNTLINSITYFPRLDLPDGYTKICVNNWQTLTLFLDWLYGKTPYKLPNFQSTYFQCQLIRTIIHQPCWRKGRWKSLT